MQFFSVKTLQIGSGEEVPGDQWPGCLERYVRGIEQEDPAVLVWPKLTLRDGPQLLTLRLEPEIGGFYAFGSGGEELPDPTDCFEVRSGRTQHVLGGLNTLFGRKYRGVVVSLTEEAHVAILDRGTVLQVGYAGLPDSLVGYGACVSSMARHLQQTIRPVVVRA